MQRRCNPTHLILAVVVVFSLTLLMVVVDAQAQIAFVSRRDGNPEIYVMDINGGNPQNLTNHPDRDWDPSWSPHGKRIAFVSDRDGHFLADMPDIPSYEIYVMDADGGNQRRLTNDLSDDRSPSWSPDGKRIVFTSRRKKDADGHFNLEIYVMDADDGNQQNLTNNPGEDRFPSWSPDGKHIVFSSRRDGHFRGNFGITHEIYVMDTDGSNQQRLTENRQYDWHPSWSPDGKRIAFSSDRKGDFENFEIYVMDADGGNQQKLTENRVYDWRPSWSLDAKRITFASERDGNYEIYVMDADGGNPQNLTNNPNYDALPAWFGSAFAVASVGKTLTIWGRLKQVNR